VKATVDRLHALGPVGQTGVYLVAPVRFRLQQCV
jgi:hypothetical protein